MDEDKMEKTGERVGKKRKGDGFPFESTAFLI